MILQNVGGYTSRKLMQGLLIGILLIGVIGPASTTFTANLHPLVAQLAAHAPRQHIAVIVQKADASKEAELLVAHLGGKITKELRIINAFAAEMTAATAARLAASPSVRWVSLDAQTNSSTTTSFTTWATAIGTVIPNTFTHHPFMVDSALGPNGVFGMGSVAKGAFAGFVGEATPGNAITKVEVVLFGYKPSVQVTLQDTLITAWVGGKAGQTKAVSHHAFDAYIGAANAGWVYLDVTNTRTWRWADFENNLQLVIDQSKFKSTMQIYYDAVGLRVTSMVGSDTSGDSGGDTSALSPLDTSAQGNVYNQTIRASELWNTSSKLQGKGVTVAVVDSGIHKTKDLNKRVRANANFNATFHNAADRYGHGTFVAGIIAGSGSQSGNKYMGVAPRADLLNVRVSDDNGMATESDVVAALQWVLDNKAKYNIRVVNLALNSSVAQGYHTSPLSAACEILWFNGIVVVVSAGNNGVATLFPPANDPFVITVGAMDDKGTVSLNDDVVASFSAYGTTESGFAKPDLVAPGRNIVGLLPENDKLSMSAAHAANRIDKTYFKMSGTSVAAPIVSGAVALLLQDEPNLTPDQVKYRLMATANKAWPGYNSTMAGAGSLDIYAAVNGTTTNSANTGTAVSNLLTTGPNGVLSPSVGWNSVSWSSVSWSSVSWSSVSWSSVSWSSVSWSSDYWEDGNTGAVVETTVEQVENEGAPNVTPDSGAIEVTPTPVVEQTDKQQIELFLPIVGR